MDISKFSLSLEEFNKLYHQGIPVIDTRTAEELGNGYIRGAYTIPAYENLQSWIESLIGKDQPFLIFDNYERLETMLAYLSSSILSNVKGFLRVGIEGWIKADQPMDMLISVGTEELTLDFKHDTDIKLLDIRSKEEYGKGHLKNAINIPIDTLQNYLTYFSTDDKLYVYSQEGKESIIAVSLLRKHGYYYSRNVEPGFVNLQETDIPIVR